MSVRKFRMNYILNEQFWLNISRVISKGVRRELTFLIECISIRDHWKWNWQDFDLSRQNNKKVCSGINNLSLNSNSGSLCSIPDSLLMKMSHTFTHPSLRTPSLPPPNPSPPPPPRIWPIISTCQRTSLVTEKISNSVQIINSGISSFLPQHIYNKPQ